MKNVWNFLLQNINEIAGTLLLNEKELNITYSQFINEAINLSKTLSSFNLKPKSKIVILCDLHSHVYLSLFSAWYSDFDVAILNPLLPEEALKYCIEKIGPDLLVSDTEDFLSLMPNSNYLLSGCKWEDCDLKILEKNFNKNPNLFIFTSGSTGMPKAVNLNLEKISTNAYFVADQIDARSGDRLFINTPANFVSGVLHFLTQVFSKGGLIARKGFYFGEDLLNEINEFQADGFGGAPTHFSKIFEIEGDISLPEKLRYFISSGDHLPKHLIDKALKVSPGLQVITMYGLTEVAGRLCILPPEFIDSKKGSVGKPIQPMTIKVINDDGNEAGPEELGQVFVQGPLIMDGYYKDADKTKLVISDKGFSTGDYGSKDADGFLWLKGRKDGVFKSGAEKVSTLVIQEHLMATEKFNDVAVMPKEDSLMGLVPIAYYVPQSDDLSLKLVKKEIKTKLDSTHIPRQWIKLDSIPRTASGKIDKQKLLNLINK